MQARDALDGPQSAIWGLRRNRGIYEPRWRTGDAPVQVDDPLHTERRKEPPSATYQVDARRPQNLRAGSSTVVLSRQRGTTLRLVELA